MTTFDRRAAGHFLDLAYGGGTGFAILAFGRDPFRSSTGKHCFKEWTETAYAYPSERDRLLDDVAKCLDAERVDVYICPYLMRSDRRVKDNAAARAIVHADIDDQPVDRGAVLALGGFMVESGSPGHGHVYVTLTESVDTATHESLCRDLGAYLGGADSKISDNDLLRLPGTMNFKTTTIDPEADPTPVRLVATAPESVEPAALAADLGVNTAPQLRSPMIESLDPASLPRVISDALAETTGDRSADTMRIVAACFDGGLLVDQTRTVVNLRNDLRDRLAERRDDDVQRCYLRAAESRQGQNATNTQILQIIGSPGPVVGTPHGRRIVTTPASSITIVPVRWLWENRLAVGTLSLLAGEVGLGKSTLAYWIAARITRGELPGKHLGEPRAVLVCAAEDSWEHTIVPRLIAARADLDLIYRVEVVDALDITVGLSLPDDMTQVKEAATKTRAVLLLLDPLMSRIGDNLDTHRDGDVRRALEPLVALADRTAMAVLGLIHHNKSGSADPLQLVMGSKAFAAVARSVHSVVPDPDDDTGVRRLFGTPKNNLGRTDLPTRVFTIEPHQLETADGPTSIGRLVWAGEITGSIADAMRRGQDSGEDRSATTEATNWLADYVKHKGGTVASADVKRDGDTAGHKPINLRRARERLRLDVANVGFPRVTYWSSPAGATVGSQSGQSSWGECPTDLTDLTGQSGQP